MKNKYEKDAAASDTKRIVMCREKQLARWIFYEDYSFYCGKCIEERLNEINSAKEFSEDIDYDSGDECGYFEDYADVEYEVECCRCSQPLFSLIDT